MVCNLLNDLLLAFLNKTGINDKEYDNLNYNASTGHCHCPFKHTLDNINVG